jgi:metal-dependent amidase/aminoacylase/carboxypeptidase family protein
MRTLSAPTRALVRESIARRCAGAAAACGCESHIDWTEGYPATVNDPTMADYVARVARQTLGENAFIPAARPAMGGEDFAFYLQQVPGCFFLLGVQPSTRQDYPSLHTDRFDFTDASLAIGMRMFVELVRNFDAGNNV